MILFFHYSISKFVTLPTPLYKKLHSSSAPHKLLKPIESQVSCGYLFEEHYSHASETLTYQAQFVGSRHHGSSTGFGKSYTPKFIAKSMRRKLRRKSSLPPCAFLFVCAHYWESIILFVTGRDILYIFLNYK